MNDIRFNLQIYNLITIALIKMSKSILAKVQIKVS